jgi:hypothetical protein
MTELLSALPGGLVVVLVWRGIEAYRGRKRRRLQQRLANDLGALLQKREA